MLLQIEDKLKLTLENLKQKKKDVVPLWKEFKKTDADNSKQIDISEIFGYKNVSRLCRHVQGCRGEHNGTPETAPSCYSFVFILVVLNTDCHDRLGQASIRGYGC